MYSFGNRYFIRFGAVVAKFYDSTKKEIWISSPNWVAVVRLSIWRFMSGGARSNTNLATGRV